VTMGSLTLSAIVFAVVLAGGAIGLELQRRLPASYTTGGAEDMTGAVVGLMTLLLALVLGLLIWTAYGPENRRPDGRDHRPQARRKALSHLARKAFLAPLADSLKL
jgi:hypothetical protein